MARARKRHVQQELFKPRGGKRRGAGRPPKGKRSSERHKRRPFHNARHPVHVTIRVVDDLGSLRKRDTFEAIHRATETAMRSGKFRIVHLTMQSNHLHLIAEADDKMQLSRGMQGFQISAAKRINSVMTRRLGKRRRGKVFVDRYHARALTTPRAVRNAIAYVLNNWRRHREDRAPIATSWKLDPYSSATDFPGWKELAHSPFHYKPPQGYLGFWTWFPKTWLLRVGWTKHPAISTHEVPGPLH